MATRVASRRPLEQWLAAQAQQENTGEGSSSTSTPHMRRNTSEFSLSSYGSRRSSHSEVSTAPSSHSENNIQHAQACTVPINNPYPTPVPTCSCPHAHTCAQQVGKTSPRSSVCSGYSMHYIPRDTPPFPNSSPFVSAASQQQHLPRSRSTPSFSFPTPPTTPSRHNSFCGLSENGTNIHSPSVKPSPRPSYQSTTLGDVNGSRRSSRVSLLPSVISTQFSVFSGPEHYRPNDHTEYYALPKTTSKDTRICSVVYPFFNEEKHELERSLVDMCKQAKDLAEMNIEVHVVAIMDGWWKSSASMKEFMKQMYPCDDWEAEPWWEYIGAIPENAPVTETYVLQRINASGNVEPVDIGEGKTLNLTVIIKRDNRRKHNSHEWFFQSFAPAYNSEYAFATDCGTLYADRCLYYLVEYMDAHQEVAAATGRQRVMSAAMQGTEDEGYLAMWYRAGQAYDYEASISSFQGAFSLVGMLPVLPGPCGMYRMDDIKGPCLDYYFDTVNINPEDTGMVTGNLLLAEDRVLSYAAALKTGKFTVWVPHAVFYFEAETDSSRFVAQRRRWTNGSFAGYIYLVLAHPGLLLDSAHTWYFKFASAFLLTLQLLMFVLVSLSPSIFMSMSYYSVHAVRIFSPDVEKWVQWGVLVSYILLYLGYIFVHNQIKFVPLLYFMALFYNAFLLCFITAAIIIAVIYGDLLVLLVVSLIMFTPFILSFLHSIESFVLMVTTFFPFMFFLPTFVAWFAAYSFSRTWDLTWGNRPSDQMDSVSVQTREKTMVSMKRKGLLINYFLAVANICIGLGLSSVKDMQSFVYITLAISAPSIIQMFLSFFYFLFYTPHYSAQMLWYLFGRSASRLIGVLSSLASFACLCYSLTSSDWLSRPGVLSYLPPGSSYYAWYGLLNVCYQIPPIYTTANTLVFPGGETCGTYGTQLVTDWPSALWSVILTLLVLSFCFSGISLASVILGAFMTDKSRADETCSTYMAISSFLVFLSVFIFPLSWGSNMNLMKWGGYQDYIQDQVPLCPDSSPFNPGECNIGPAYILLSFALFFSLISAYCFRVMRAEQISAKAVGEHSWEKEKDPASIYDTVLQARIDRLEQLVVRARLQDYELLPTMEVDLK